MSAVSYVLARAAEEGIAEAALGAASPFDPLLRNGIRKKARKAIADAGALTRITDEAHVIRVAFLHSVGRAGIPLDDPAAVEAGFAAAKVAFPKKKRAVWPASGSIAGVLLIGASIAVIVGWAPSRRARFARSAVGEAFGEGITDYVIGVDRRDGDRIEKGRKALLSRGVKSQAGQVALDQIDDALQHTLKLTEALSRDEENRERERVGAALRGLDAQLTTKKIPAFLDEHDEADVFTGVRHVWLLGYYAEQRADVATGGESFYFVWGRRLDTLNIEVGGVVYTSNALEASVVALDEVEGFIGRRILPGLGKNGALAFGAEPADELTGLGRMERRMGTAVRAEILPAIGSSEDDGTELHDLLESRHNAFVRLHVLGDDMFEPHGITMSDKMRRALARRDTEVDAKELLRIDDRLKRGALVKGFEALTAEQAKIDERRSVHDTHVFHRSGTIATGALQAAAGKEKLSVRASSLVGGWLGVVFDAEQTTLALTELARHTDPDGAANLALFSLETELGSAPTWLVNGRFHDEEDALRALDDALERPPADVKRAAGAAYAKLLGEPVPTVVRTPR